MELIDKDALLAEIDKRIKNNILLQQKPEMSDFQREIQQRIDCLKSIRGYILNTLEVKDVDLDCNITGIKSKRAEGHLKECIESITEESLAKARKQLEDQFEENRIAHCDALTEEQAQIESDFVTQHIKENNRTPTFIDAIEYGMQLMHEKIMKGGVEGTVKFVNTGDDDPFVKFICPDLDSSKFRLNQRVKIIILKKEKL